MAYRASAALYPFILFAASCSGIDPSQSSAAGPDGLPSCSAAGETTPCLGAASFDLRAAGRHLVLLYTADEHSHLLSFSPELDDYPAATRAGTGHLVGGVARRAAVFKRERAAASAAGSATLTVSAGDNQMGALPEIAFQTDSLDYRAMSELGYDVTTIGNHELDLGPAALARSIEAASSAHVPPIVASNVHFSASDAGDDSLAAHFSNNPRDRATIHPYRVVVAQNGLRVGFIGYLGVDASRLAPAKAPVTFSERDVPAESQSDPAAVLPHLYADLQPIVDHLRKSEKVDLVVALSHAGIADSAHPEAGEDYQVASHVAGIDVIVSGHAHNRDAVPIAVRNPTTGRNVVVLNAGAYGQYVGRIDLFVPASPSAPVTFNPRTQTLLPVDESVIPDPILAASTGRAIEAVERATSPDGTPYLAGLLSRIEGHVVSNAPRAGDLYFHPLTRTSYDLADAHGLLFLATDAELRAVDDVAPTEIAIESAGNIRGVLAKGKTGTISAADAFSVLPLGVSPTDGSVGYPMVHGYIPTIALRAIFEVAANLAAANGDYDLAASGARVEYDCSRPPVVNLPDDLADPTKGRVMRIWLDSDHSDGVEQFDKLVWDASSPPEDPMTPHAVTTSFYIAEFASSIGVTLFGPDGMPVTPIDAIVKRQDGSEIKSVEALMMLLEHAPSGALPATYDAASPLATTRFASFVKCP